MSINLRGGKMQTSLSFLNTGEPWPPKNENDRLKKYKENCLLFEGQHQLVYTDWVRLVREDQMATMELILNWHKRLSLLWGDLLLSEPPRISSGEHDSDEQKCVDRIIKDNEFITVVYEVVLDTSRLGTGIFKIRYDKKGIIEGLPPSVWFPVVRVDNIKDVVAHVLAWSYKEKVGKEEKEFLKCEIHEKGRITTRIYNISDGYLKSIVEEMVVPTGIDEFLVIPIHNVLTTDKVYGIDDYSDLDTLIQELEIRIAQISRVLDKHVDPNMYGPETAVEVDVETGEPVLRSGGKYFPIATGEQPPAYVTWDGQLDSAFKEIDLLMEQLYFLSETSPAAFGQLKTGLAESGSALRRLMMTQLLKTARIRMRLDPALKKVLITTSKLERAQGMPGASPLEQVDIFWNDGLPADDTENTAIEATRYTAGLTSLESAVKRLYQLDGDELTKEIERINEVNPQAPSPPEVSGGIQDGGQVIDDGTGQHVR